MKKILFALLGSVLVAILLLITVPSFIDWNDYKEAIIDAVKEKTGRRLFIQGDVRGEIFPFPAIRAEEVFLANTPGAKAEDMLYTRQFSVRLSLVALLKGEVHFSGIYLKGAELELEVLPDGRKSWDFSQDIAASGTDKEGEAKSPSQQHSVNIADLTVVDSTIRYRDTPGNYLYEFSKVNIEGSLHDIWGPAVLSGSAEFKGQPVEFNGEIGQAAAAELPVFLKAGIAGAVVEAKGQINRTDKENPKFAGNIKATIPDLAVFIENATGNPPLQITAEGRFEATKEKGFIKGLDVLIGSSSLKGEIEADFRGKPSFQVALEADNLDLDPVRTIWESSQPKEPEKPKEKKDRTYLDLLNDPFAKPKAEEKKEPLLPGFLGSQNIGFLANVRTLIWRGEKINDLEISADLNGGELVIQQASARLPGDSLLVVFGILSTYRGEARLEGNIEMQGKKFRDILSWQGVPVDEVDPKLLGAFALRGDLYLSGTETRLSDLQFSLDTTRMFGAAIVTWGDQPTIEATVRINEVDMDRYFPKTLPQEPVNISGFDMFEAEAAESAAAFKWLESVNFNLVLQTNIDQVRLAGEKIEKASFVARLSPSSLILDDMRAYSRITSVEGMLGVKRVGNRPHLMADVKMGGLNTDDLRDPDAPPPAPEKPKMGKERWSREHYDFAFLRKYDGDFKIGMGRFKHGKYVLSDVSLEGVLKDRTLKVESLSANVFGGALNAKGNLTAGSIATLGVAFTLKDTNLSNFLGSMADVKAVSGRMSISGTLSTSGIDEYAWVSNLEGSVNIIGVGISMYNFDLPGLARRVINVSSVSDVINLKRFALAEGSTVFTSVEGDIFVKSGIAETPGIRLVSETADGYAKGKIDLPNWTTDMVLSLMVKLGSWQTKPEINLSITGQIEDPKRELDTKVLEEYVAKKAAEQLLKSLPKFQ